MNYDVDLGPLLMSDWYHADAFSLYQIEIATPQAPLPETNILNGKGVFDCEPATDPRCTGLHQRHEILFQRGTAYKLGLVNTGSLLTYKFWIDGHSFTVVQTDFVPIKPYVTDVLIVGIGTFNRQNEYTVTDFLQVNDTRSLSKRMRPLQMVPTSGSTRTTVMRTPWNRDWE